MAYKHDYQSYIGKKFGKWTIKSIQSINKVKYTKPFFYCECECGRNSFIQTYRLIKGLVKACNVCANIKHGHNKTPTNQAWNSAKNRCNNPNNKDYKDYGGRGIIFCEEWNKFENFLKDMGEKPKGLTLDRINNDLGYSKENCRWATYSQQNSNQRKRRK